MLSVCMMTKKQEEIFLSKMPCLVYEDSPMREQGLYASDSRNQMLCGYYAFSEFEMAKSSLELISRSMRENGYVNTCAPCDINLYIPSFSFIWIIALCDYMNYSNDVSTMNNL